MTNLTSRDKYVFLRGIFMRTIPALLLIFVCLQGAACAADAGGRFTHNPFVPSDPIMPLSEVKPGMKGECLTVIRGADIVSFEAEVIDIVSTLANPKNMILIKVSGRVAETSGGIASGMSGSPFYIGGRLVGAIGYGWSFTDHFHGLVTPIEDMLEIWNNPEIIPSFDPAPMIAEVPPADEPEFPEWSESVTVSDDVTPEGDGENETSRDDLSDMSPEDINAAWNLLISRERGAPESGDESVPPDAEEQTDPSLQTIFISGISPRMASQITETLGLQAAPFGGASDGTTKTIKYNPEIKPGMAIGASLMWGDVEVSGIGTLTAVSEDGRFIAFAHPLANLGPTAMVLTDAHISTVISALQSPFKIGTTGDIIGVITQDRPQGVGGRIGRFAPAASVAINLTDVDSGRSYKRAFQMVQDKYLLSNLASPAITGVIENLWGRSGGGSAKVTATYYGSALPDGWKRTNIFVSETDVAKQMLAEFNLLTQMFALNPFQELRPFGVDVEVEVTQEPRVLYIEDVKIEQNGLLRPGDTVSFDITLRPWRRDPFVRTYSLKVPDNVSGIAQLLVRGGGIAEETAEYHEQAWRSISSLPILLGELDAKETNDQMVMEIRGQESLSAQIARARRASPDDLMNEKLNSEIREEKMLEGSMRVIRTNYYVDGIIHKLINIEDGRDFHDEFLPDDEMFDDFDDIEFEEDHAAGGIDF